jgi:hypothetical protein
MARKQLLLILIFMVMELSSTSAAPVDMMAAPVDMMAAPVDMMSTSEVHV